MINFFKKLKKTHWDIDRPIDSDAGGFSFITITPKFRKCVRYIKTKIDSLNKYSGLLMVILLFVIVLIII